MWVAKIQFDGSKALFGSLAVKYKVIVTGYPIASEHDSDVIRVTVACYIFGEAKNKQQFIAALSKQERLLHIEAHNNFLLCQIIESPIWKLFYHHQIIHVKPLVIDKQGNEILTIGSWNRENITNFIEVVESKLKLKIHSITRSETTALSIVNVQPYLSIKQQRAIELAIEHGYYSVPRKVTLETLAKLMGISFSTFQVHLRKAEYKIMPALYDQLNVNTAPN